MDSLLLSPLVFFLLVNCRTKCSVFPHKIVTSLAESCLIDKNNNKRKQSQFNQESLDELSYTQPVIICRVSPALNTLQSLNRAVEVDGNSISLAGIWSKSKHKMAAFMGPKPSTHHCVSPHFHVLSLKPESISINLREDCFKIYPRRHHASHHLCTRVHESERVSRCCLSGVSHPFQTLPNAR